MKSKRIAELILVPLFAIVIAIGFETMLYEIGNMNSHILLFTIPLSSIIIVMTGSIFFATLPSFLYVMICDKLPAFKTLFKIVFCTSFSLLMIIYGASVCAKMLMISNFLLAVYLYPMYMVMISIFIWKIFFDKDTDKRWNEITTMTGLSKVTEVAEHTNNNAVNSEDNTAGGK
jgi:hypothetical protein